MRAFNSSFTSLSSKANRLFYYIEKTARGISSVEEDNKEARKVLAEVINVLRCEGAEPSHQDIFFLLRLFNSEAKLNDLAFLKQNLENRLDKIRQEMEYLNVINFKCDEVVNDGTT